MHAKIFKANILWIACLLVPLYALAGPAPLTQSTAQKRYALVVTNARYNSGIPNLAFTQSDGEIISGALTTLDFKVTRLQDGTRPQFREAFRRFLEEMKAAGPDAVAFFYFSGHAGENGIRNYILRSDKVEGATQNTQVFDGAGIPFADITDGVAGLTTKASFVVIDSHLDRDEPGLFRPGLLFATQGRPGLNAADSNNFSLALSAALLTPGLDADGIFSQARVKVAEVTAGRQVPFFVNNLPGNFSFGHSLSVRGLGEGDWLDDSLWLAVKDSKDIKLIQVYLERFPNGKFASEARARIAESQRLAGLTSAPSAGKAANVTAGRRVGNSSYQHANFLRNPRGDAEVVGKALASLGFEVVQPLLDVDREGMAKALKAFSEVAKGADWAVIYYAGHGMEVKGVNYLIPVDARLEDEEDAEEEAIPMSRLFDRLRDVSGVKILILDACRDNPLANRMVRRAVSRSGANKGLAEVKAASGTLIAYATNPGDTADDGEGDHSPYVTALLAHLAEPGQDVRIMFSQVYDTVNDDTKGRQQPWYAAQLPGRQLMLKPN